jgi:hypothetical protein
MHSLPGLNIEMLTVTLRFIEVEEGQDMEDF